MVEHQESNKLMLRLEFIGGSSKINTDYIVVEPGEELNTLIIEGISYKLKDFHWIEQGYQNMGLAVIGLGIGATIGLFGEVLGAILGGLIGAGIFGWKYDNSLLVLVLLEDQLERKIFVRCTKSQFKAISQFLN